MLLTTHQVKEILGLCYAGVMYKLNNKHFTTAKKFNQSWAIESWEVLEMRERQLAKKEKRDLKKRKMLQNEEK